MSDLKITEVSRDRTFTTKMIEGLSVEEMNDILNRQDDALGEIMENHGFGDTFYVWKCGYGIYSIRHFGGDLLVNIGNSCD